mmetsp:Transcript_146367/g.407751  ORF Transcript_146367/g.407751 Transcript_146367/m.407751 type:complete len:218 (-) Transcript_146367:258-911(-)
MPRRGGRQSKREQRRWRPFAHGRWLRRSGAHQHFCARWRAVCFALAATGGRAVEASRLGRDTGCGGFRGRLRGAAEQFLVRMGGAASWHTTPGHPRRRDATWPRAPAGPRDVRANPAREALPWFLRCTTAVCAQARPEDVRLPLPWVGAPGPSADQRAAALPAAPRRPAAQRCGSMWKGCLHGNLQCGPFFGAGGGRGQPRHCAAAHGPHAPDPSSP